MRGLTLVLLAVRWSSPALRDEKHSCRRHGRPLVRLPGGINPNPIPLPCGVRLRRQ